MASATSHSQLHAFSAESTFSAAAEASATRKVSRSLVSPGAKWGTYASTITNQCLPFIYPMHHDYPWLRLTINLHWASLESLTNMILHDSPFMTNVLEHKMINGGGWQWPKPPVVGRRLRRPLHLWWVSIRVPNGAPEKLCFFPMEGIDWVMIWIYSQLKELKIAHRIIWEVLPCDIFLLGVLENHMV